MHRDDFIRNVEGIRLYRLGFPQTIPCGDFAEIGGEGSILGVAQGTILLQILQNLVNLLGIPSSLNFAVMGSLILFGVIADQQFSRRRARWARL